MKVEGEGSQLSSALPSRSFFSSLAVNLPFEKPVHPVNPVENPSHSLRFVSANNRYLSLFLSGD